MELIISVLAIFMTISAYAIARKIYQYFPSPFTVPLLISTVILLLLLSISNVSYDTYMLGGNWLEQLLGPAVVALALPLYKQRQLLKKFFLPLSVGVTFGAIFGMISGMQLAKLVGVEEMLIYSLIPKSVTTPVAMEVASLLGGVPALAAVFVMIAGIGGVVFGPAALRLFRIQHFISKGVGLGIAAHAIGTSRALEYGELEGAVSSVAMSLGAIIVSLAGPLVVAAFL